MSRGEVLESRFVELIAEEVSCTPVQATAAAELLAGGATVPFIARYRKEVTGGLDDEQLENLAKRRTYFLELAERRDAVLESIAAQGVLTDELEAAIRRAVTKQELEDLYLPYRPKRRTRAAIAREKGLQPLTEALLEAAGAAGAPEPAELAQAFIDPDKGVEDADQALAGARDILAEQLAEQPESRARLRRVFQRTSLLKVTVLTGKEAEGQVYRDYFECSEPAREVPSHRLLAMLRGEREGILLTSLAVDDEHETATLASSLDRPLSTPCGRQLELAAADAYKRLLRPSIANEYRSELQAEAEAEAIRVFRANLSALLMQPPLGQVPVMGLDPGLRTGCKLAVVDSTGKVVATAVIYPVPPGARPEEAAATILGLVAKHRVQAIAIGNGTAGRETEAVVREIVASSSAGNQAGEKAGEKATEKVIVAIVPETGASVYSASAVARDELPELDVVLRGAVSIARRLQDPLAELVKIEPRSLGVGQYQHDVDQRALTGELDLTVESVVNRVGVEINTASSALLRHVSGLSERLAKSIVAYRDTKGAFPSRARLLDVQGLGPKTYELAAGFLRVRGSVHPLDATAVHPERYGVVERMAGRLGVGLGELVGNPALVGRLDLKEFVDDTAGLGLPTLSDIRSELERPGRDPRPDFEVPEWRDDVRSLEDLELGMTLEGRVSNVTNFGAFVDIGVKRDGLVHTSQLSHTWVDNPRDVIAVGDVVKVQVLEVDHDRGRISLSIKALQSPPGPTARQGRATGRQQRPGGGGRQPAAPRPEPAKPGLDDLARKLNRPLSKPGKRR